MAGQAWNRKGQPNRVVLEHARVLLLALAALVERAAGLPTTRRLWFLAVMAGGEAEARRLIVAMAAGRCPRNSVVASVSPLSATDHCLCTPPTVASSAVPHAGAGGGRPAGADRCGTALPARLSIHRQALLQAASDRAIHPLTGPAGNLSPVRGFAVSATMFFLRTGQGCTGRCWRYRSPGGASSEAMR